MRKQFVKTLIKLAETDKKIILLTGDLGFSFVEPFAKKFPSRFINCGIAEANMVGLASGMAMLGWKPYCYSISTILLSRAYEQIRNEVCYQNLNVKLIGTSSGNFLGFTHNFEGMENSEDLLRNLPNIDIWRNLHNSDGVKLAMEISYEHNRPTFIEL